MYDGLNLGEGIATEPKKCTTKFGVVIPLGALAKLRLRLEVTGMLFLAQIQGYIPSYSHLCGLLFLSSSAAFSSSQFKAIQLGVGYVVAT